MSSLQGKGNFQKPNLCFGGLGNFPQKIFSQTNYLYINKSLQEICCSFFEVLSINESFQLNYSRFNSTQSKNNHNNRAFLFTFNGKKSFTIFALFRLRPSVVTQRPMIIIANLKKSIRVKASRPLVIKIIRPLLIMRSFSKHC